MGNETARITLAADSRGIRKGTQDLRGLEKQAGRVERSASRMAKRFGVLAGTLAAGLFTRGVIQNTIRQEKATAILNATLRATGRYSEETSQALQNHANALQQTTTFGNEAVNEAQGLLLTFKELGGEVFPRATKAILDMSIVMNQDLKSSTVQIGKALNDPVLGLSALSRVGVSFTDVQKDMIKEMVRVGDVAGAQAEILKELESEFGGAAEAARNTFGGALQAVGNAFGDLLEGDAGSDGMRGATEALNELADLLNSPEVKQGFAKVTEGVVVLLSKLVQLPGAFGYVKDEIKELFGIIEDTDIPRVEDQIERLRDAIETESEAFVLFPDLKIFGRSHNDMIAEAQAELDRLIKIRDDYYNTPPPDNQDQPDTVIPGLDRDTTLDPISLTFDTKDAEKWAKDAVRLQAEIKSGLRKLGEAANEDLTSTLNDLTAQQGGEATQAAFEYAEQLRELDKIQRDLAASGQLTVEQQERINESRRLAGELYQGEIAAIEAERAAIEAQLTVSEQLIADLQFEKDLMSLSNEEREKAIALRYAGADATNAERQSIVQLLDEIQAKRENVESLDALRSATAGLFMDIADGSKSAGDAFENFMERMRQRILQMLAEKLVEKLFGSFGTTDGGIFGGSGGGASGGFGSILAGLFGGAGRALGGPVHPGRLHPVLEKGEPEMLTVGEKKYLLTGGKQGTVEPLSSNTVNNHTRNTNIVVKLPPEIKRRTATQTAQAIQRVQRQAEARNQ